MFALHLWLRPACTGSHRSPLEVATLEAQGWLTEGIQLSFYNPLRFLSGLDIDTIFEVEKRRLST